MSQGGHPTRWSGRLSPGLRRRVSRISGREEMRPGVVVVFFRAPSCGKMIIRDGDVLKTRPLPIELEHDVASNRAAGFRNMRRRRRILIRRQSDAARINDHLVAGGRRPWDMTVRA